MSGSCEAVEIQGFVEYHRLSERDILTIQLLHILQTVIKMKKGC